MLHTLSISVFPALMIVAAMTDVTSFKIPNWLTGLIAASFFPMALLIGMPLNEFMWHVAAGLILFFVGYALFALGMFGGGDSKLMAAAGLWFGTSQTVQFLTLTALAGGILALIIGGRMIFEKLSAAKRTTQDATVQSGLKTMQPKLPYGFAIAVGAIMAFPDTYWMKIT
jgi:prepilin peptidase CpaA